MPTIQHIKATNILSFGSEGIDVELRNLNVLIGPNGSGKSNFLELFDLLRSTPTGIQNVIREGGGANEWVYKGNIKGLKPEIFVFFSRSSEFEPLEHSLAFEERDGRLHIDTENLTSLSEIGMGMLFLRNSDNTVLNLGPKPAKVISSDKLSSQNSILAQIKDPDSYPELSYISSIYESMKLYREWNFGRSSNLRKVQPSTNRTDELEPDFSNLGLFLNRLRRDPNTKRRIIECLRDLYKELTDFEINIVEGGYLQILLTEGNYTIPAVRLSDGTLRYLCLLAILLDPTPPPLICIEEPELGLHNDMLPKIADLLIEASERTQLIVTTHSDILIDALSETPESVLVCEKHDGQTQIKRLDAEQLAPWLRDNGLGTLWTRGEIGGNRW